MINSTKHALHDLTLAKRPNTS